MNYLQLHPHDTVAVALDELHPGQVINTTDQPFFLIDNIHSGHKLALKSHTSGEAVYKYGSIIGHTTQAIKAGEHVHSHNLKTRLAGIEDYQYAPSPYSPSACTLSSPERYFEGYKRQDGKVGTRNEVWVISTVGCVAKYAERIARLADHQYQGQCDGIFSLTHPFGCSQMGDDHKNTQAISAALALHPNAGGILFVGLGCENNQIEALLDIIPTSKKSRIRYFNCQSVENEIEAGLTAIGALVQQMSSDARETCSIADLTIGMKCGGSDSFSGLTANPLTGRIADIVCQHNGTVLLTETPEMFGAEQLLMNRASSVTVFDQIVSQINSFKQYFIDNKQSIYENPSPGNKAGGITTLEEKSLGAIQKGGTNPVQAVLNYGEPVTNNGLTLLQSPGNDAVSSTALTASGANILLFTTGRGTPLGFPAPTIKIASNSALATNKTSWIDFDAGPILEGQPFDKMAQILLDQIIETASGKTKTKSEINEQREIAIWKTGVTL